MAPNGDAWVLGWSDSLHRSGGQTLAARWDGTAWGIFKTPNRPRDCFCAFLGGAASSGSDVWAVGNNGGHSLIEHWDGATWSFVHTPTVGSGSALNGAVALADDSAWAVGSFDNSGSKGRTLTEHWNGTQWSVVSSPNVGDESFLQGVAAVPGSTKLWAVGYASTGGTWSTLIELYS